MEGEKERRGANRRFGADGAPGETMCEMLSASAPSIRRKQKLQAQSFRALMSPKVNFFQWHLRDFPVLLITVHWCQDKWVCPEARQGPLTDKWFQ